MRWLGLMTLLLAGAMALLWAADDKKPDDSVKGFYVHEWGVWRVHDDMEFANADMRAEWGGLPAFVYGQTTTRELPHHSDAAPMVIFKPVLFFHAPRAMPAEVRVDFLNGVPAVWWPATEYPAVHDNVWYGDGPAPPPPPPPEKVARYLEWKLQLKQPLRPMPLPLDQGKDKKGFDRVDGAQPLQVLTPPLFKPLSQPHWMQTLRDVKCDEVFVSVGQRDVTMEREKFVYYDGLLPRVKALTIKVEKEKASLKNQEKFAVFDVWVIDNRDAAQPRLARLPRLDAGAAKDVNFAALKVEDAAKALTTQLKDAGLNEDEAASLTTIWTSDLFRSAGVTLFYRVPQEEYDHLLPLTVKPRPEKIVRVGLIQQIPFDTELAERIAKLVKQLDDDQFNKREAAQQQLAKLGPIAVGYLRRLKPTINAPEPKRRIEELLEKHEAQRALKN